MEGCGMSAPDIDAVLNRSAALLEQAAAGAAPLLHAAAGLRQLLVAIECSSVAASAESVARLDTAIRAATPSVTANAGDGLASDRIYVGVAAAIGFVQSLGLPDEPLPVVLDRFDHVALVAAELDALHRRRQIAARGGPLARYVAVRRALATTADGATPH
jgi:hypothetical protein